MIKRRRGQAMVEMALSLPLLVLVLSGVIEMGMLISNASVLQEAVNQAARSFAESKADPETVRARVASYLKANGRIDPQDLEVKVEEGADSLGSPTVTVTATARLKPFAFDNYGSFKVNASATYRREWGGPLP